jgi:hypothetical protein
MPSKTKKQLNLFKIVKSYVDGGGKEMLKTWYKLYPKRKITNNDINKIIDISRKINYNDLIDMASGMEGDDVLGETKNIKVGYWIKFKSKYQSYHGEKKESVFIAKITSLKPYEKIAKFNPNELYNKNGTKINPVRKINYYNNDNIWLDMTYYDNILETERDIKKLIMKNENLDLNKEPMVISNYRKELHNMTDSELAEEYANEFGVDYNEVLEDMEMERENIIKELVFHWKNTLKSRGELYEIRQLIKKVISESFKEKQDTGGLKVKVRNSNDEVSVKTGMLVQKKSDESKGKIKNVGVDDSIPAKNNINVEWYHGDLKGTTQTVYPEDIEVFY